MSPLNTKTVAALSALAVAMGSLSACVEDSADTSSNGKGEEENPLTGGKEDSFFRPTEHGKLVYGVKSEAAFTADETYHAWTFTASGQARIKVRTHISPNLDTVMYVYYRESSDSSWGRYIDKNDDANQDVIWSQVDLEAKAGEYRVIVKPFKAKLRGSFAVEATCSGDGCDAGTGGSCNGDFDSPRSTGFAPSCANDVRDVVSTPVTEGSSYSVLIGERCDLEPAPKRAVEMYFEYWDDIYGWEDFVYDPDNAYMNVSATRHGDRGHVVTVDVGGDEDTLIFVFDDKDDLVMFYHDEQSPTQSWYCQDNGEADADEPSEYCVVRALYGMPHDDADTTTKNGDTTVAGAAADIGELGGYAVETFAKQEGLDDSDDVEFEITSWGEDDDRGAIVTLTSGGVTATFDAVESWGDFHVLTRTDDGGISSFVCDRY